MTLQFEPVELSPGSILERRIGRHDHYRIRSGTDMSDPALVEEALQIHAEGYVNMRFVKPEALTPGGVLPGDIDKARGDTVEYFVSSGREVDAGNRLSTQRATMRKISIPSGFGIDFLPAYKLCADSLEPKYREYLESIEDPSTSVKEIAALARTKGANPIAVFELLRDALQDAREHEEVWFFSIVSETYDSLVDNFGPHAIKRVGESIAFDDDRIGDGIKLVPALVKTDLFIDEIQRTIMQSSDKRERIRLTRSFMFFTEGLKSEDLSEDSRLFHEHVAAKMQRKSTEGAA